MMKFNKGILASCVWELNPTVGLPQDGVGIIPPANYPMFLALTADPNWPEIHSIPIFLVQLWVVFGPLSSRRGVCLTTT